MEAGLGTKVDLGVRVGLGSWSRGPSLEEPEVVEPDILASSLSFAIVLLSYAVTPIRAESSFDLFNVAKPCKKIFCWVVILK